MERQRIAVKEIINSTMDLLDKILKEVKQDKDVKDKDGTQPAKYYAGDMSKSTKDKRDAHFKAKKSGPAPGDASAKTKKSKHTMKYDRMFNEDKGLDAKAKKSGISKSILKKVYDRGLAAYKTGHRPGATAPQWAMARVNSFITKGKGTWGGADKDLAKQVGGKSESTNESVEEGKYVSDYRDIVDVIFKKIKSKIEKDFERNQEKGIAIINTLGAMVGHKVTDKGQEKHKLFLKFGEELEEKVDVQKQLSKIKGLSKKQLEALSSMNTSQLTVLVQQLSSLVMGEQDECWDGYTQKGMKKKGDKMVPNCVPEEIEVEEDRDYKKEYENYHSDPKQIKRRAKRNEARRSLKNSKKLTADKDVHHKDNNPMNNDKSNLSIVSKNYNRKEPRMRDKLKEKGCLPNGKRK